MGLNVYFCDVCGVRVTDVDLRSGHGMLRGQDVICATCLDMGHGKEWLASRGVSGPQMAVAATNGHAPAAAMRATPVVPSAIAERLAAPFPHHSDDEDTSFAPGARPNVDRAEAAQAAKPLKRDTDYAGAATAFAALGGTPAPVAAIDRAAPDAVEQAEPVALDPTLLPSSAQLDEVDAVEIAPVGGVELEASDAPADEEDDAAEEEDAAPPVLDARNDKAASRGPLKSRSKSPGADGKRSSAGLKPSSKPSSKKGSSPAAKSSSSRFTKPKSSRTQKAAGGGMPMPLKISLITVPLILILGFCAYAGPALVRGSRGAEVKDMQAEKNSIEKSLMETTRTINNAVGSKDLKTLQAANSAWLKFLDEFGVFTDNAKRYSGWTEEQCATYSSSLKIMDLGGRSRLIRDDMVKLQAQSH